MVRYIIEPFIYAKKWGIKTGMMRYFFWLELGTELKMEARPRIGWSDEIASKMLHHRKDLVSVMDR